MGGVFRISSCLAAYVSIGVAGAAAGDMSYYKNTPTFEMDVEECDSYETGRFQFSCKYIEVGSIDGYLTVDEQRDPRWPKLEKYWNNTSSYLKFAGIACARAVEFADAEQEAMDRSYALVDRLIEDFEGDTFTGRLANAGYRKVDGGYNCVEVPYTGEYVGAGLSDDPDPTYEYEEEDLTYEEEDPAYEYEEEIDETTATFILHNEDRYRVGVEFYSVNTTRAWPGGNRQFNLSGTETYRLACNPGEKICFGAWRDYQTIYWGVGRNKQDGCTGCCTTCGYTLETTLRDGGPDSYPESADGSSAAGTIANVIGAIGLGLAIGGAFEGGGYSGGSPSGNDWGSSGISE